ncbi:MAG: hypothetical protein RXO43_03910 [Candidatus Micrarchaeota archaeon]
MQARAPGVIKLLGEHAVVYGKLSLASAISLYAHAKQRRKEVNLQLSLRIFQRATS